MFLSVCWFSKLQIGHILPILERYKYANANITIFYAGSKRGYFASLHMFPKYLHLHWVFLNILQQQMAFTHDFCCFQFTPYLISCVHILLINMLLINSFFFQHPCRRIWQLHINRFLTIMSKQMPLQPNTSRFRCTIKCYKQPNTKPNYPSISAQ